MLAFRIFVMLSCLIIVPMAAIFGSAFPDVVKSVLVDRIVAWSGGKPLESKPSAGEVGGVFAATPAGNAANNAPSQGTNNWEAPRWGAPATGGNTPNNAGAGTWSAPAGASQAGAVVPAGAPGAQFGGGNRSASFAAPAESNRGSGAPRALDRSMPDDAAATASGHNGAAAPDQPDQFTAMERKLRGYGAVYYLLETWGSEGELYRFHCRMAIANNPSYTRHFEATDRDALKAMSQVLARVEAWRAGRLQ